MMQVYKPACAIKIMEAHGKCSLHRGKRPPFGKRGRRSKHNLKVCCFKCLNRDTLHNVYLLGCAQTFQKLCCVRCMYLISCDRVSTGLNNIHDLISIQRCVCFFK